MDLCYAEIPLTLSRIINLAGKKVLILTSLFEYILSVNISTDCSPIRFIGTCTVVSGGTRYFAIEVSPHFSFRQKTDGLNGSSI